MPCWTVQKNTVALKGLNDDLLRASLRAMGYVLRDAQYSARFDATLAADRFSDNTSVLLRTDGTVEVTAAASNTDLAKVTNELKRTYAAQTIASAARKFGWNMKLTGENKLKIQRRY